MLNWMIYFTMVPSAGDSRIKQNLAKRQRKRLPWQSLKLVIQLFLRLLSSLLVRLRQKCGRSKKRRQQQLHRIPKTRRRRPKRTCHRPPPKGFQGVSKRKDAPASDSDR